MTDDFGSGARWTVDLWPYDAIVLFDWLMTVDFDQIPVEHKAQRQALADLLTVLETQVPVAGVTQAQIDKAQDEVFQELWTGSPVEDDGYWPGLAGRRDDARRGDHTATGGWSFGWA